MKKENVNQKKKIAKYFLIMLLIEIIFSLVYVFIKYKNICELNVTDNTIMPRFYIGVFVGFGALLAVLVTGVVLYMKAISFNEK